MQIYYRLHINIYTNIMNAQCPSRIHRDVSAVAEALTLESYIKGNTLYQTLGGPQVRFVRHGEEKGHVPLPGIEPRLPARLLRSPACTDRTIMFHLEQPPSCAAVVIRRYAPLSTCRFLLHNE
jgi:hypothetical protein